MGALYQAGASVVMRTLSEHAARAGGADLKHATEIVKTLKKQVRIAPGGMHGVRDGGLAGGVGGWRGHPVLALPFLFAPRTSPRSLEPHHRPSNLTTVSRTSPPSLDLTTLSFTMTGSEAGIECRHGPGRFAARDQLRPPKLISRHTHAKGALMHWR